MSQQPPEWPTVALTSNASKYKVHKLHQRYILKSLFEFLIDLQLCKASSVGCTFRSHKLWSTPVSRGRLIPSHWILALQAQGKQLIGGFYAGTVQAYALSNSDMAWIKLAVFFNYWLFKTLPAIQLICLMILVGKCFRHVVSVFRKKTLTCNTFRDEVPTLTVGIMTCWKRWVLQSLCNNNNNNKQTKQKTKTTTTTSTKRTLR